MMSKASDTQRYELVCGMEVHAELKTTSKMFCGCKNDPFKAEKPNIHTCPVCLGMPGGLPVPNKTAIEWTIKLGLALGCKINLFSKFDRKHYFYPDLPKGYQISQYDLPFCYDGELDTSLGKIRIRRIHLEEDTGKLLHKTVNSKKVSLVDFNRGGVPLVEIVTEPDITTPEHAKAYAKKLRQIIRYLDIADCDMEQGGMRLEANTSLRPAGTTSLPNYKVEVKNINSFKFVEQAIGYEMTRQAALLDTGDTPAQETRGWNINKNETFAQRTKEDAEDYRYFPDPDIPPLHLTEVFLEQLKTSLPELPDQKIGRWSKLFKIEKRYGEILATDRQEAEMLESIFAILVSKELDPNLFANMLVNKKLGMDFNNQNTEILINHFIELTAVETIDHAELETVAHAVISAHPTEVDSFHSGKTNLLNFFVGQTMRQLKKKVDVGRVKTVLSQVLQDEQRNK